MVARDNDARQQLTKADNFPSEFEKLETKQKSTDAFSMDLWPSSNKTLAWSWLDKAFEYHQDKFLIKHSKHLLEGVECDATRFSTLRRKMSRALTSSKM